MKLKVEGLKELENLADIMENDVRRNNITNKFMVAIVSKCDSVTKKNTPTITGTLKGGWRIRPRKTKGKEIETEYYSNVEYASYVEYGHRTRTHSRWVAGKYMLRKGMNAVERNVERIAKTIIERELKL